MKVALIGYGYWGINIARTINEIKEIELVTIFDEDIERINEAKKLYDFSLTTSLDEVFSLDIEAVFIATPPATHYKIAKQALNANKHIFVEKPFTLNLEDAYELIELAEKNNLKYMVEYIFIYSEPVKYLKNNIQNFGDIVYINSRRINLELESGVIIGIDVSWLSPVKVREMIIGGKK